MSVFLYQLEGGGNWVLNSTKGVPIRGGYFLKDLRIIDGIWNLGIIDPVNGSYVESVKPLSDYKKENEEPYRSPEELERLCGRFFGNFGGVAVPSDKPMEFVNPDTGLKTRIGQRTGYIWAVDVELTETGFSGEEGVDWEFTAGNEIV